VEPRGTLVVTECQSRAVVRVNPITGNRDLVSGRGRGIGRSFRCVEGIAVEPRGTLIVTSRDDPDPGLHAVVRVEPVSGNRTIVSNDTTGSGPPFEFPQDIAAEASGTLVVTDQGLRAVVRVEPVSGNRTIVSSDTTGTGPPFVSPTGIAVEADGALVVTDSVLVVRVDPTTGDRTIVSK
jgi:sugar lactone lactonase YvrE